MTDSVSFTRMDKGTAQDYELLAQYEAAELADYPDRVLGWLQEMDTHSGYQVTRLEHCLQGATRAHRAGEETETVVCVLLHDIGDILSPINHSQAAASLLRPFISDKNHWIIKHHGVFQLYYYADHTGGDRNARDRFKNHPWYQDTVDWCENYDQVSFDPDYDWLPLEFFEPMVRSVLSTPRSDLTP